MVIFFVTYLWKYTETIEKSKLGEKGINGDGNTPNGPETIMRVGKAHK